ncbi:MFS transporter [Crossiella cryophila]|uniref:MFS family permease n=1 Tax=Crossiella cryophila TaxID=43355 RepID=A0A7W7FXP1_9PSEU|nr:MFS transporter [Crossiella cryophila]MBB4679149.1 MFS family permease [Crossiella cryophila]
MGRNALLVALGVDSFGTGVFLPISVLYLTFVIGVDLPTAGIVGAAATAVGLFVPPLAGHLVDRWGPRAVLVTAQFVQAAGAVLYLVATSVPEAFLAAALLAAGQRGFYCSVFVLIADLSAEIAKDKPFALAGVTMSVCFGAGAGVAGLLIGQGDWAYRLVAAGNAISFLVCAAILLRFVRPVAHRPSEPGDGGFRSLLRDRPYLGLILVNFAFALAVDLFVLGIPVYLRLVLGAPAWTVGAVVVVSTVFRLFFQVPVVHWLREVPRTTALLGAGVLWIGWALATAAALLVPAPWQLPYLLVITLVCCLAALVHAPTSTALAEAAAPPGARGRYVAAFQYSFGASNVAAPAVIGLTAFGPAIPWLLLAGVLALATAALPWLGRSLPMAAVRR